MPPPTSGVLISAAVRVLARAVAIEIETVAAAAPPVARAAAARAEHAQDLHVAGHAVGVGPVAAPGAVHMQVGPSFSSVSSLPPLPSSPPPSPPPPPSAGPPLPPKPLLSGGAVPLPTQLPDLPDISRSGLKPPPGEAHLPSTPKLPQSVPEPKTKPKPQPKPQPKPEPRPALFSAASQTKPASEPIARVDAVPAAAPAASVVSPATPTVLVETPAAVKSTAPVVERPAEKAAALEAESEPVSKLPVVDADPDEAHVALRASTVPSSRLGRLLHYGSLAASLSIGAATESIRRTAGGGGKGSVFMSDANVRRLVATLGRMRGAALKLGQFMSIQDNTILPPEIERVLHQIQTHANYMPDWQMEKVMIAEFGQDWPKLFGEFDRTPVAAASIGQVHRATLPDGTPVAVKIQFPGVSSSIASDLANLSILLRGSALLPKGLYLQNTIAVMRRELEDECDYIREGQSGASFAEFLKDDPVFQVPRVIEAVTTRQVLTTEWMSGRPLSKMKGMDQETRDYIGTNILRLCLQELFQFRLMQTDPNWGNFLYDSSTRRIQLIDFGASREYTKEFMDGWYRLLQAALDGDKAAMKEESERLGYLTGEEEQVMVDAHLSSMSALASPFQHDGEFPFAEQTITDEVRALIPVMLEHRLTPPPAPTYSLNRKLSGAFLMCSKLGANVDCKALWKEYVGNYAQGPEVD